MKSCTEVPFDLVFINAFACNVRFAAHLLDYNQQRTDIAAVFSAAKVITALNRSLVLKILLRLGVEGEGRNNSSLSKDFWN